MAKISITLPNWLIEYIDQEKAKKERSRSWIIYDILRDYYNEHTLPFN